MTEIELKRGGEGVYELAPDAAAEYGAELIQAIADHVYREAAAVCTPEELEAFLAVLRMRRDHS